jgi:hypothetical protein
VSDFEGFAKISDYILDGTAFYEVDDCTTSEDNGVDLKLVFNRTTGKGSVTFPKDVEEIEARYMKGLKIHYVEHMKSVLDLALTKEKVAEPIVIEPKKKS